jgi:peptide-methionine (S)-S-oxide reductase
VHTPPEPAAGTSAVAVRDSAPADRSGIYVTSEAQRTAAEASKAAYQRVLSANGYGPITTEIVDAPEFYFAEDYHQQYLAKVPHGYCGLGGTGLSCPVGLTKAEA